MSLTQPPLMYRPDWDALPPKSNPGSFTDLVATVCHYTAANKGYAVPESGDHSKCVAQVQSIQRQHQAISDQSDIEYNALTCNHGYLFEGRVLGYKGGANGTADSNKTMPSICCLLGVDDQPSDAMLNAVAWFHSRVEAQAGHKLEMKKHMEIVSTSCPGVPMSALIDDEFYRDLIDGGTSPQPPTPPPSQEDSVAIVIAAPAGANARFLATADGKGFISSMTWIPDEASMARLVPHYPVVETEADAPRNIGLIGPVPTGDALRNWSIDDFLNAR
jgi:hypothetical protein